MLPHSQSHFTSTSGRFLKKVSFFFGPPEKGDADYRFPKEAPNPYSGPFAPDRPPQVVRDGRHMFAINPTTKEVIPGETAGAYAARAGLLGAVGVLLAASQARKSGFPGASRLLKGGLLALPLAGAVAGSVGLSGILSRQADEFGTEMMETAARRSLPMRPGSGIKTSGRMATPAGVATLDETGDPMIAQTLAANMGARGLTMGALGGVGAAAVGGGLTRAMKDLFAKYPAGTLKGDNLRATIAAPSYRRGIGKGALIGSGLGLAAGLLGGAARGTNSLIDAHLLRG